ncbi:MAG: IS256 family transposase [Alkalibacterium sp.]|uniref:IS256 family transposase n=1 Tax=Alkalibacterium sp. TaxID=1872447 RepID=UPI003970F660
MTQFNLNINFEELTEGILKSDMNSKLKSLAVLVMNAYMETERDEYINAKKYERSLSREDYRNGYYSRHYTVSVGSLELNVPRTRSGEFSTELFERYQRMDQVLVLSMIEAVINGVSTRKVTKIVEKLCGEKVSKSFVSSIMKRIDPEIDAFNNRSLTPHTYRYVYVDALYIKVRENHRIVSKAVYIAIGINEKNRKEIIGFKVADAESTESWTAFFQDMRARGLKTPKMIISDAHEGLKSSIKKEFVGSAWQRCTVHFLRNILEVFPKKDTAEARRLLKNIFRSSTFQEAKECKEAFETFVEDDPKYEKALEKLDNGFMDSIQYLNEPEAYHVSLRTTNTLERLNREVRRREKVISIFPNVASAVRLIGAVLLDVHEKWLDSHAPFLREQNSAIDEMNK